MRYFKVFFFWILSTLPMLAWFAENKDFTDPPDVVFYFFDALEHEEKLRVGVWSFLKSAFYYDRSWRCTLQPIVLALVKYFTDLSLKPAFIFLFAIYLLILTAHVFALVRQLSRSKNYDLLVPFIMLLPYIQCSALVYMQELPYITFLVAATYWLIRSYEQVSMRTSFFFASTFFLSAGFRPLESVAFFGLFLFAFEWQAFKSLFRALKSCGVFLILIAYFGLTIFAVSAPVDPYNLFFTLAAISVAGVFTVHANRRMINRTMQSANLSLFLVGSYYLFGGARFSSWITSSTFGKEAGSLGIRTDFFASVSHLFAEPGILFYILLSSLILSFIYLKKKFSVNSPAAAMVFACVAVPLLGLVSKNGDLRYYYPQFILLFLIVTLQYLMLVRVDLKLEKLFYLIITILIAISGALNVELLLSKSRNSDLHKWISLNTIRPEHSWKNQKDEILEQLFHFSGKNSIVAFFSSEGCDIQRTRMGALLQNGTLSVIARDRKISQSIVNVRIENEGSGSFDSSAQGSFAILVDTSIEAANESTFRNLKYRNIFGSCRKHPCKSENFHFAGKIEPEPLNWPGQFFVYTPKEK